MRCEVNAVIELGFLFAYTCACIERQKGVTLHKEATRKQQIQTTPKKQKHQKNKNNFFQTTLGGFQQSSVKNYCCFVVLFFVFFVDFCYCFYKKNIKITFGIFVVFFKDIVFPCGSEKSLSNKESSSLLDCVQA